jgi:rSAM/selenodomain-associated transferase 1
VSGGRVVYVIAKAPQPRTCKTRLSPPLSRTQVVGLARAFLLDAVEIVQRAGIDVRVMCRSAAERDVLVKLLGASVGVSVQRGRGLGLALESAFVEGRAEGCQAVGVFGADSPTLDPRVVRSAFAALEDGADVALGLSVDGGYYLLAARELYPDLFHRMPWGASTVADFTLGRCERLGLMVSKLPSWYDVDDWAGLVQLREEIRRDPPEVARHTRRQLEIAGLDAAPVPTGPFPAARLAPHGTG